jgi:hypothetical protein
MEEALVAFMRKHRDTFRQADERRHQRGARRPLLVASVPLDLTGLPAHYPVGPMTAKMPSVTVRVFASRPGDPAGSWIYWPAMKRGINLYVTGSTRPDDARPTLQHELRHMVQSLLWDALGTGRSGRRKRGDYGAPAGSWDAANAKLADEIDALQSEASRLGSRSPRGKEIAERLSYLQATHGPRYYLTPAEFYPHLGNTKDALVGRRGSGATLLGREGGTITEARFRDVTGRSTFLAVLREFAPDLYGKAMGELRAWTDAHNADVRAAADRRPITTSRILSDLQDRLDRDDPVLAAELRLNRARYEALARSLVTR